MRSSRRALRFLLVLTTITAWFLSGFPQIWNNPPIPPEIREARAAGEAVHYHERVTTRQQNNTTSHTTAMTASAAELTAAGFAANDEVLILVWAMFADSSTYEVEWQVTYNGTDITSSVAEPWFDFGAAGRERSASWMGRQNLGTTIQDIDLDFRSNNTLAYAYLEKAEIFVVRLSDFGTENTDWFWNKSTTNVVHTTTYSATNRAAVTWTPSAVEDWVAFGYIHVAVDNTNYGPEAELMLDGALVAGDFTEEGESSTEEHTWLLFDYVSSLSTDSHTYDIRSRDRPTPTTYNDHRESAIFVFRKAVWSDIFVHEPATVSVANATDVQAATITNSLSTAQNAIMWGEGELNIDVISKNVYLWIRQGGSTTIDPVIDDSTGLSNAWSYDATDELHATVLAYKSLSSGTQDLDLFVYHDGGSTENFLYPKFIVWGMNQGAAAVVSVSVSDGNVAYGMMPANTSKSTLSGDLNDMQTATNDGNVTENLNIKGQDATGGGCTWILASSNGSDQYIHQFCNDTDLDCSSPPTNYTALTTGYQALDTGIAQSGSVDFQLRLTTPNPSSCYGQQSVNVTIQAIQQ